MRQAGRAVLRLISTADRVLRIHLDALPAFCDRLGTSSAVRAPAQPAGGQGRGGDRQLQGHSPVSATCGGRSRKSPMPALRRAWHRQGGPSVNGSHPFQHAPEGSKGWAALTFRSGHAQGLNDGLISDGVGLHRNEPERHCHVPVLKRLLLSPAAGPGTSPCVSASGVRQPRTPPALGSLPAVGRSPDPRVEMQRQPVDSAQRQD